MDGASGGRIVRYVGNSPKNDLTWPEVKVDADVTYVLAIDYASPDDRTFVMTVDNNIVRRVEVKGTGGKVATINVSMPLSAGVHSVCLSNVAAWMPDIDRMTVSSSRHD